MNHTIDKPDYLKAFKHILRNKSALSCMIVASLISVSFLSPIYAISFFTLFFKESLTMGATFYSLASAMGILGVLVGGRLINRIGRKSLAVVACVIQGVFTTLIVFMPNSFASAVMWMMSAFFGSATFVGFTSLVLEQVPDFRGTMISLNTSFQYIGYIVGLTISGLILNLCSNSFQILYIIFGLCGIVSAVLIVLFTRDPCKNQPS